MHQGQESPAAFSFLNALWDNFDIYTGLAYEFQKQSKVGAMKKVVTKHTNHPNVLFGVYVDGGSTEGAQDG